MRRAEGESAVGTANKHHVGRAAPGRQHTGQHINVVISGTAGAVNRKEQLPTEAYSIYTTLNDAATEANSGVPVKSRCLAPDLRVARANAAKC